jgi:hypothetical protein
MPAHVDPVNRRFFWLRHVRIPALQKFAGHLARDSDQLVLLGENAGSSPLREMLFLFFQSRFFSRALKINFSFFSCRD